VTISIRALLLVAAAAISLFAQPRNPEQWGPYPVGVTSLQLDDSSRVDPELGPRPLRTEIWYPASDAARSLPKNLYSEFVLRGAVPGSITAAEEGLGGYRKGLSIAELDRTYRNIGVRDAQVRDGKWPLVVFSHGSGGTRVGYVFFTEFLASHGFIVVAADHIGNARYTIVNGKVVAAGGPRAQASAADRPKDVRFLIDQMTRMNAGSDSRFAGRIDLDKLGAAGMSFGGSTTMNVIEQDRRVKAAIMMAPGGPTSGDRTNFNTPVCMMIGSEDSTIREVGNTRNRAYYEASKGPKCLVEIKDGGHYTFTSVEQYNPEYGNGIGHGKRITAPDQDVTYLAPEQSHKIVNAYGLAFLGLHLRGETGYRQFLAQNHYGDKIVYKFAQ